MKIALNEPFLRFLDTAQRPRISLYFPTHRAGPETRQDPIRLKNLLRQAREQLEELGRDDSKAILKQVEDLLPDTDFWRHLQEGLAILASPEEMKVYKLPFPVPELAVVADDFHLNPLLPLFSQEDHFHLLALNKSRVQLYEGNRYSIRSVEVPGMPTSLAEALQFDDGELQLQQHTSGPKGQAGHTIFHGQGAEKEVHPDQLLRFFRAVNKAVREYLRDSRLPLVLAGVEYFYPIYREANTCPQLVNNGGVPGSTKGLDDDSLHRKAWEVAHPYLRAAQEKALERFETMAKARNGSNSGTVAAEIERAVVAAFEGRVDALLIPNGKQVWGEFHEDSETVKREVGNPARRRDLIDLAALNTLRHGGEVFIVPPDRMPDGLDVAALLRYEAA
jgi:hypothetical protein